ncbi:hypothetical protein KEM54_001126, partial [Ascosphaera aggregata]
MASSLDEQHQEDNALRNRHTQMKHTIEDHPGHGAPPRSSSSSSTTTTSTADAATLTVDNNSRGISKKISSCSLSSSGQSTPLSPDAPPSAHILSTARKDRRAAARKKLFYNIDYKPRPSTLDPSAGPHDFHGFFSLFWLSLAMMVGTTLAKNWFETGHLLRVSMWGILYANIWQLGRVDALMVASTGVGVILQKAIRWGGMRHITTPGGSRWGLLRWECTGFWLQCVYELVWLSVWANVPLWLGWTWTATVFFTLHVICLLMKMHSYTFYNGHLSACELEIRSLDREANEKAKLDTKAYPPHSHAPGSNPNYSPSKELKESDGHTTASSSELPDITEGVSTADDITVSARRQVLANELTSTLGHVTYPMNLRWADYGLFLCSPTLCYELEYPRVKEIHYWNIAVDALAVFGCIFLMILVSGEFIVPVLRESNVKIARSRTPVERAIVLAETVNGLLTPFLVEVLLAFLVIFEYVCGASAELTRFADRRFYEDWWNSADWLEFSRKWNLPVHHFLRRHVYFPAMNRFSSSTAIALTFFLSSVFHELVMANMSKKIRGYGFVMQMSQVPLSFIQKHHWVRQQKRLNNVFFWFSIVCGTSLDSYTNTSSGGHILRPASAAQEIEYGPAVG